MTALPICPYCHEAVSDSPETDIGEGHTLTECAICAQKVWVTATSSWLYRVSKDEPDTEEPNVT